MNFQIKSSAAILAFSVLICISCKEDKKKVAPTNSFDTGRLFIESRLKGDYPSAASLLVKDKVNQNYLDAEKQQYDKLSGAEKKELEKSHYIIREIKEPDDSTCLITYDDDYRKKAFTIFLVRKQQQWLVDFKYSFIQPDSLK